MLTRLVMFGVIGFVAACEVSEEARIEATCADYCAQGAACDDETDVSQCEADCADAAGDCQNDELDQALDELDECAAESCDDIGSCTIGAGLECYLGL